MEQNQKFEYAVIGGGAHGLSIAYYLSKKGHSVAIFEKFTIGNDSGSSHGASRISRSFYSNKLFSEMHDIAIKEYWPEIQKSLQAKVLFKNQLAYFTDDEKDYLSYETVAKGNEKFKIMNSSDISKRYNHMPQIKTQNPVIIDKSAAIIGSAKYLDNLQEYLRSQPNIYIFQHTSVTDIRSNSKNVLIQSQSQIIVANKVVLACGRWIKELAPEIDSITKVTKQIVAYINLKGQNYYKVGRFPSFAQMSQGKLFYFLPDLQHKGLKVGYHNTKESELNLETFQKELRKRVQNIFGNRFKGIERTQQCYYTSTKNQEFIIDWIDPEYQRILVCSCCSGHGFKFSPLIGKIASDILIENQSIKIFEQNRHTFQIPYHKGINLS